MTTKYYINLSAGLLQTKYTGTFVHIQSSHTETHSWDRLFYTLPDDLLYNLAIGNHCVIVDCSSNKRGKIATRALPVIIYFLEHFWFGKITSPLTKKIDKKYRPRIYSMLSHHTKMKIKFYRKFLQTDKINLSTTIFNVEKEL